MTTSLQAVNGSVLVSLFRLLTLSSMQVQLVSHVIITSHTGVPSPIVELTQEVYDNTIDGEPIIEAEPVIHPGGSQDVDYQKVQTIGVASVVQVVQEVQVLR